MKGLGSEWTREDSRFVDGRLPPEAQRDIEESLPRDAQRRERLDVYRDAMDIWRDDAQRCAKRIDAAAVADRVLASRPPREDTPLATRYAAAAVLLLGIGLAGSAALGPHPGRADLLKEGAAIRLIEAERLSHQERVEWELNAFGPRHLGFGER